MAQITCKVVDSCTLAVQGVYVILERYGLEHTRHPALLHSITDENGEVTSWYPIFSSGDGVSEKPVIADITSTSRASLAFFPHPKLIGSAPWTSIRTEIHLGGPSHHVVLHLSEVPHLEFCVRPVTVQIGPVDSFRDLRTPSPFLLSSPVLIQGSGERKGSAQIVDSSAGALLHHRKTAGRVWEEELPEKYGQAGVARNN
ncbi:hypothetical protein HDV57DRAFT_488133 [Trichoderma longibrachiatum]